MGNTVPPRASSSEATGTGKRDAGTGRRRSENVAVVVTEAAPPATATPRRRVVTTTRKLGRRGDDGDVEEEEAARAGGADGAAPAAAGRRKVLTVKIVMSRKDAEALVARLVKAESARRERKARMAVLKGQLRAGSCGGGGGGAGRRPMLPPIKENRFERTPVV